MSRPKAALFDMDGLLLETEKLAHASFLEVAAGVGMASKDADALFRTLIGTSEAETTRCLTESLPIGTDMPTFGEAWSAAMLRHVSKGIELRPTVAKVLDALTEAKVPMAVVTSSRQSHAEANLAQAGIRHHFQAIIGGDRVTANKPDPEPYLMGAKALGVDPADCAAFEDSDLGTQSALRAGCRTFQVPDMRPEGSEPPEVGQGIAPTLWDAVQRAGLPLPLEAEDIAPALG